MELNITRNNDNINKLTNHIKPSIYHGSKIVSNIERINKMIEDNKKKVEKPQEDNNLSVELGDIITSENGMSFEVISEEIIEDEK